MNIKKQFLLYSSLSTIILIAITFVVIYSLFTENRKEQFQQRQLVKIYTVIDLINKTNERKLNLQQLIEDIPYQKFYTEYLLIIDSTGKKIFDYGDRLEFRLKNDIINKIKNTDEPLIWSENNYDIVAVKAYIQGRTIYAIHKALDFHGLQKLQFLLYVLIFAFVFLSITIFIVASYISDRITRPLYNIIDIMNSQSLENIFQPVKIDTKVTEIIFLSEQFNKLMNKINQTYQFQKNTLQHISHELKTPIAILVSNFDRMTKENNPEVLKTFIEHQKQNTKRLADIIDILLELSKFENNGTLQKSKIRLDELIFNTIEDLNILYPAFNFTVEMNGNISHEELLTINANENLIKLAINNILNNCVQYSINNKAKIIITYSQGTIQIDFINKSGKFVNNQTMPIFDYYFRGDNSIGKKGFGLGLVLTKKIIELHNGHIHYTYNDELGIFTTNIIF